MITKKDWREMIDIHKDLTTGHKDDHSGSLDWELNKFANHLLTKNIELTSSNQIAQVIIDYLNKIKRIKK